MTYRSDFEDTGHSTYEPDESEGHGAAGVWDFAKAHPLPTALVGLGLGYLAVSAASGRRPMPERAQLRQAADRARGAAERARTRANALSAEARREGSQVAREAVERAHVLADAAEARARRTAASLRRRIVQMESGAESYARSHPFVVGAVAFGLGAAMGGLLPRALNGAGRGGSWEHDEADDAAAAFADDDLQGEGDYRAAHHYREAAESFTEHDDPTKRAREAAAEVERDPDTFRKAEAAGRKPAGSSAGSKTQ